MAARAYSGKKPKNLKHTLRVFLSYLGRHKKMLAVVAVLVTISAGANLLGTYMIRPVVNGLAAHTAARRADYGTHFRVRRTRSIRLHADHGKSSTAGCL